MYFQLTSWFEELKTELHSSEIADTVEGAEELICPSVGLCTPEICPSVHPPVCPSICPSIYEFDLYFQLTSWFEELKTELHSSEIADTVEGAEELICPSVHLSIHPSVLLFMHSLYPLFFQLTSWFEELKTELHSSEIADTVEGAEELIAQFNQQKEATTDASTNTVHEGETLLDQLRLVDNVTCQARQ